MNAITGLLCLIMNIERAMHVQGNVKKRRVYEHLL